VDCHFILDLVIIKYIVTLYVRFEDQLGDIFIKSLDLIHFLFYIASWACLMFMLQLEGGVRVISIYVGTVK